MKRFMAALLILACLFGAANIAWADAPYRAKIRDLKSDLDRVKLREKPSTGGKILGQYFEGVFLQVLSGEGEWVHVRLGGREGYMMREFITTEIDEIDDMFQGFPGMVRYPGPDGTLPLYSEPNLKAEVLAAMPEGYVGVLGTAGNDWLHIRYDDGKGNSVFGYASSVDITHTDNFSMVVVDTGDAAQKLNLRAEPSRQGKVRGLYYNGTAAFVLFDDHTNGDEWEKVRIGDAVGYMLSDRLDYSSGGVHRFLPPLSKALKDSAPCYETLEAKQPAGTLAKDEPVTVLGARGNRYYIRMDVDQAYRFAYVEKSSVQAVSRSASATGRIKTAQAMHRLDQEGKMSPIDYIAPADAFAFIFGSLSKDMVTFSEYVFPDSEWLSCSVEIEPHTYVDAFVPRGAVEYDKELEYRR